MKKYLWFLSGNISYALMQWVILVMIFKLTDSYNAGLYSLGLAVATPVMIFFNLQLRNQQAIEKGEAYNFSEFFFVRAISTAIALTLIFIGILVYNPNEILISIAVFKFIDGFFDILFGRYHQRNRTDKIGKVQIARTLITLLPFYLSLSMSNDLFLSIIVMNSIWVIILVLLYYFEYKKGMIHITLAGISNNKISTLIKNSLPLAFSGLMISLLPNIPKYLIQYYLGASSLGIYTALITFLNSLQLFVNSVTQFFLNKMAKYLDDKDATTYRKVIRGQVFMSLGIVLVLFLIFIPFGDVILVTMYTKDFKEYANLFNLFLIGNTFLIINSILLNGLFTQKKYKTQLNITTLLIVLLFAFGVLFVPSHGLLGIAIAMILTYCLQLLITSVVYYKSTRSFFNES